MANEDVTEETEVDEAAANTLQPDWKNPPSVEDLAADLDSAQSAHITHTTEVEKWLGIRDGDQTIKSKRGRSKIVPKLARKQAEWRYAALSEPFLSTDDLFNTAPVTFEDKPTAEQNGQVVNYQINSKIDKVKFVDEYVRTAVDEGTVIVRLDWEFEEGERKVFKDIMEQQPVVDPNTGQPAIDPNTGQLITRPVKTGTVESIETVIIKNQPVLNVVHYENIVIDPTSKGDLDDAEFVGYSFETSLSDLKKDGRYHNLDDINLESASILNVPDHAIQDDSAFTFKDKARKKIVAKEYWGFWDINDTGKVVAIVATWVGRTMIRLEENPYPDKKVPFVLVQYLPRRNNMYGEPDSSLIEDNQKIIGAVTRGMIDIIGRSANGQQGIRKDALDVTNARKFERGDDYKFNANVDPSQAFHMETYPEIPRSALEVLNLQTNEAESLTGIKPFGAETSGQPLGNKDPRSRSALDPTSKRELGILRRLSNGFTQLGRKIISMNSEFLQDEEIIRITNEELIAINRNDLGGEYDIKLNISTAEADEQKASELAFMLQTVGNSMPLEMTQIVLSDIAKLRKMPELAKRIEEFKPAPDPLVQAKAELELELLKAQIANENAKAQENAVDVDLKRAKTANELAKARDQNSKADINDLNFLDKESGADRAHEESMQQLKHANALEGKEHDRLTAIDKEAVNILSKNTN